METRIFEKFKSAKDMVNFLMENEGVSLGDGYGREWYYQDYKFYFKDITDIISKEGVYCLHLFSYVTIPTKRPKAFKNK